MGKRKFYTLSLYFVRRRDKHNGETLISRLVRHSEETFIVCHLLRIYIEKKVFLSYASRHMLKIVEIVSLY